MNLPVPIGAQTQRTSRRLEQDIQPGPEKWRLSGSSETSVDFNGLQGVISQKTELFITTAVGTLNPITLPITYLNLTDFIPNTGTEYSYQLTCDFLF
jgi:hypothetical protein